MKILTEKRAEELLRKEKFEVIQSIFVKTASDIPELDYPVVMKVSGEKIVHKNVIGGIRLGVQNRKDAEKKFAELMKIKGCEEVAIQKQIKGTEFLLGIKNTPEFGHVLVFGAGGVHVEKLKDVSFRVFPITKKDALQMIDEVKRAKNAKMPKTKVLKNLLRLNKLIKKYPNIQELDINPLIVSQTDAVVVDARIVFQ